MVRTTQHAQNFQTVSDEESNERLMRELDDEFETKTGEQKTSSTCNDAGHRESQAKRQKRKTRGKRGGQAKRLSQNVVDSTDVNSPGLGMVS